MQNRSFISNLKNGFDKRIRALLNNPYKQTGLSWLKIKQLKHLPSGKLRSQSFLHKQIYFISPPELLHGIKEIFVEELYRQNLQENPYIIDCGANIGLSVIYMKEHYPGARIIAFEPDEINFKLLTDNINSFGYTNVTLRKEAVWISNTQLSFSGSGSMSGRIEEKGSGETKRVNAIRLKELLTEPVDFLKIDIEGAEYAVLADIREELSFVKNLFVEYHGTFRQTRELSTIFSWLSEKGFSYYIKEAAPVFATPFERNNREGFDYDVQLNIFCFREAG